MDKVALLADVADDYGAGDDKVTPRPFNVAAFHHSCDIIVIPDLHWISEIAPLRLTQMARPRAGDWMTDEIAGWQRAGVGTVVSLLEQHEVRELKLEDEPLFCTYYGIDFLASPMPDGGTPHSLQDTSVLVDDLVARLHRKQGVAIHCRAGIGRSGLLSACVLLRLGVPLDDVFPILSRARKIPIPDTPVQVEWVRRFASIEQRPQDDA